MSFPSSVAGGGPCIVMVRGPQAKMSQKEEQGKHEWSPGSTIKAGCKSNYVELELFKELSTPTGGSYVVVIL